MSPHSARIFVDTERTIGEISRHLFGGFAEHMGRCIYEGVYDPDSPLADADGLRADVLTALRDQQYSVVRYPGGNFLSGYNWLDGIGPKQERPIRRELAWLSVESNQFGTNEFVSFCRKIGADPMLGVNMGTGTIQQAADLVEYCNAPAGTYWADLRKRHGFQEPHAVKYWCVGNEMDGYWQIGHLESREYGRKAQEASKLMKLHDPSIKTVLCGSSSYELPTYPEWDRVALDTAWDQVDYHSIHYYATNWDGDTASYLAVPIDLENFVDTAAATLRYVKAKRRSSHDVFLSWDEWQVWYKDRSVDGRWTEAPHLSEEVYNLEDALVVAQWLSVFLRKCDVLKVACVAQIVNVISWLQTRRDGLLRQTSYYPFWLFSRFASGLSLDLAVKSPEYSTAKYGPVALLDASASYEPGAGSGTVFVVNRSQSDAVETEIRWQNAKPARVEEVWRVSGAHPTTVNTFERPDAVTAKRVETPVIRDGVLSMSLPPLSLTVVSVSGYN